MALYDEYLKKAAQARPGGAGQDSRLVEARRRLAAQEAAGRPVGQAAPLSSQPMPGVPTPQMRNVAGQFGTGIGVPNVYSQAAQTRGQDTVPAMLSPGEAVIPAQQAAALARAGLLDDATGVPQKHLGEQLRYRDAAIARGAVLGFATGGVVPGATGATMTTTPPKQAIEPQTPPNALTGPSTPQTGLGQPSYQTQYQGLPQFTPELQGQIRAQESQRLQNIERARLAELGSAAASSGALLGGDVKQIAAGINAERIQAEAQLGTELAVNAFQMQREDAAHLLDDNTRRYMADLAARTSLEVARLQNPEPGTLEAIGSSIRSITNILSDLGISGPEAVKFLGGTLGGLIGLGGDGGGPLEGARGPYGTSTGGSAGGAGGGTGGGLFNPAIGGGAGIGLGSVAVGGLGAWQLGQAWGGTGGVGQAALGGAGVGFAVGGPVGAAIGAGIGALGEVAGIGPSDERIRRDSFTKLFDGVWNSIQSSGAQNLPPTDPNSLWTAKNRAALANTFATAARVDATEGSGISGPDWQRMRGMGLAEYIPGSNNQAGWFIIDDPRVLALLSKQGAGPASNTIGIKITQPLDRNPTEGLRKDTGASLAQLIQRGAVQITNMATGEPIDLNTVQVA